MTHHLPSSDSIDENNQMLRLRTAARSERDRAGSRGPLRKVLHDLVNIGSVTELPRQARGHGLAHGEAPYL